MDTPVPEVVRANALMALEIIPKNLRSLVKMEDTGTGTIILEWESSKGFVAIEIGTRSYNMTYVPDDLDGTQWGSSGSMVQLTMLRSKLSGILPAHDKLNIRVANVLLFNKSGRFVTSESWDLPLKAEGPWSMKDSPHFRRADGGAVLVPTQEPWGFPYLIL